MKMDLCTLQIVIRMLSLYFSFIIGYCITKKLGQIFMYPRVLDDLD